jgi:hypothetical protein
MTRPAGKNIFLPFFSYADFLAVNWPDEIFVNDSGKRGKLKLSVNGRRKKRVEIIFPAFPAKELHSYVRK